MKINLFISILLFAIVLSSCKKKGCTDGTALNFSVEAQEDDGSCEKATMIILKSLELKVLKTVDDDGVEWDVNGLPDCFLRVNYNGVIYESEVENDVDTESIVVYKFEPNYVVYIDSITETAYPSFSFGVYDKDSTSNKLMASSSYVIFPQTIPAYNNNSLSYFFFYQRVKLANHSVNGNYNHHVSMTVNFEWK